MIDDAGNQQSRKGIEHTDLCCPFSGMFSLAVAARVLTQGILKLMAKMKASPSDLVKLADRISEMPDTAVPETFAPKVELTRLPPVP